jgi:hypothetical protein
MRFKFRPSSHSTDYTVVATYKSKPDAIKTQKTISAFLTRALKGKHPNFFFTEGADWFAHNSKVRRKGKMVVFTYDADKRIKYMEKLMKRGARPSKLYWEPQKLTVHMLVPISITPETAPNVIAIVLNPNRAKEIAWLNQKCSKPCVEDSHNNQKHYLVWKYWGTQIYNEYSYTLELMRTIDLHKRADLSVSAEEWRELYED